MSRKTLKAAWYWVARFVCQMFCTLVFRVRFYGRENVPKKGAFLLAGNHQSYLDPVFCGVGVNFRLIFVARDSLFRFKLLGWLIGSLDVIPISRGKADIAAMKAIIARLREGRGVCLYPEATRTHDGRIQPIKAGFGLLCRRSQAAVVPVLIDGAFECWPRDKRFFSPGTVTVWYGTVLTPEQSSRMSNQELADYLTRTLRRMQHDFRIKQGKEPYTYYAD